MLKSAIWALKRRVHNYPALYSFLYNLVTRNFKYYRLRFSKQHYPSAFGGLWTDRDDFYNKLRKQQFKGTINEDRFDQLQQWRTQGFVCLERAVEPELVDAYLSELGALKVQTPSPLAVTSVDFAEPELYTQERAAENPSVRTVDDYFHSEASRRVLFHRSIMEFLNIVFEREPVLTQSLNFERGAEQEVHQDTAFVIMTSPLEFVGVCIALEDVTPGSGELVYFPGSHRWPDYRFSGRFKHYDEERDGREHLNDWVRWIYQQAHERGTELAHFYPKKGDVFIWHGGLAYGGAPVTNEESSRHSLVGHFCAKGVRPLYMYYKPSQRKFYKRQGQRYSSAYYS